MSEKIDFDGINEAAKTAEFHRNEYGPGTNEQYNAEMSISPDTEVRQQLVDKAKQYADLMIQADKVRELNGPGTDAEASLRRQAEVLQDDKGER